MSFQVFLPNVRSRIGNEVDSIETELSNKNQETQLLLNQLNCSRDTDCSSAIANSYCDRRKGVCQCERHFYNYVNKECLSGTVCVVTYVRKIEGLQVLADARKK